MKDNNKNSIDELLIRYLTDLATDDEKVEVVEWLNFNNENQNYFNKFKSVWESSSNLKAYEEIDTESSLKSIKKRIDFKPKPEAKVKPLWMLMRVAAILVIFLGLYLIFSNKDDITESISVVKIECTTEVKTVILPDKSVVTLNLASLIEYPEKFDGNERRIKFKGEAYFEISPDKSKPFIIETGKSETKVVGTAFNLKAKVGEKTESIVVTEGIVEFSGKTEATKHPVRLVKGEKAILNNELKKEKNEDPNFMSWKTGVFVFDDQRLKDALPVLSGYYKVEFELNDSLLSSYTLSGNYDKLKLDELIEVLEMTLNLKIAKKGQEIWLSKKGN